MSTSLPECSLWKCAGTQQWFSSLCKSSSSDLLSNFVPQYHHSLQYSLHGIPPVTTTLPLHPLRYLVVAVRPVNHHSPYLLQWLLYLCIAMAPSSQSPLGCQHRAYQPTPFDGFQLQCFSPWSSWLQGIKLFNYLFIIAICTVFTVDDNNILQLAL